MKATAKTESIRYLMRALYSTLGNKRYLHDFETLLNEKLADIAPNEDQILLYLARDISGIETASHAAKQPWKKW